MKNLKYYFTEGFKLANKNLLFFIIYVTFSLINLIIARKFVLLDLFVVLVFISYEVSMPLFLFKSKKNHKNEASEILKVIIQNIKRLIIPAIGIFILLILSGIILGVILVIAKSNIALFSRELISPIGGAIIAFAAFPFHFVGIIFSIEKKGLYRSVKESFKLSFKNYKIVLAITIILAITSFVMTSLIPLNKVVIITPQTVLRYGIVDYMHFVGLAISVVYYIEVVKKS